MSLKEVREARKALRELEMFGWEIGWRTNGDVGLAAAAKPLIDAVTARHKADSEALLALEKRVGCEHCGAQENEDCRIDRDGDCLFAEDARRISVSDAWDGASFMGPTRL